ncbi:Uncharacterised protein [Mycobacteroides abscessus subsp. abscessus]|nr:Uncharacterised protein [Mycobacteroides abscessus subsp. abscessus]
MLHARPGAQHLDNFVRVDPSPLERIGELIQHVEAVLLRCQPPCDFGPPSCRVRGVVRLGSRLA